MRFSGCAPGPDMSPEDAAHLQLREPEGFSPSRFPRVPVNARRILHSMHRGRWGLDGR